MREVEKEKGGEVWRWGGWELGRGGKGEGRRGGGEEEEEEEERESG